MSNEIKTDLSQPVAINAELAQVKVSAWDIDKVIWQPVDENDPTIQIPERKTEYAFAADVRAYIPDSVSPDRKIILEPGEIRLIGTGLKIQIPPYLGLMLTPRSGLALKHGLSLVNSPGIVDSDYTDEIGLICINLGKNPITIVNGDRIAQCYLQHRLHVPQSIGVVTTPSRGGGFGSTGV